MEHIKNYHTKTFNLIRILVAVLIFFGHATEHLGVGRMPECAKLFDGVPVFFFLSGFLIFASLERDSSLWSYAKKRFIRIYPVLWIGVLLGCIAVCVLYFKNIDWVNFGIFTVAQSSFFQFWTPDFLREFGCGTLNGSLWTIPVFVQFYVVAYLMHKYIKNNKLYFIFFGLSIVANCVYPYLDNFMPVILQKLIGISIFIYLWLFIIGGLIWKYKEKILPFITKYWYIGLILQIVFGIIIPEWDIAGKFNVIKNFAQVCTIMGFCYKYPNIYVKRDISFEFYIFHMIIINIFIEIGFVGSIPSLILAFILSLVVACVVNIFVNECLLRKFNKN